MNMCKKAEILVREVVMFTHFIKKELLTIDQNVGVVRFKNLFVKDFFFYQMFVLFGRMPDPMGRNCK